MQPEAMALPLPEGVLACDEPQADGSITYSLTAHALAEMERHKWLESEKRQTDTGEWVLHEWLTRHWTGWIRGRLLEHLYGWRRWSAFDPHHFGLFRRQTVEHHVPVPMIQAIGEILLRGGENLDVVAWAHDTDQDMESVLWLLDRIDINAVRHRLLTDHIRLFLPPPPGEDGRPDHGVHHG